MVPRMIAPFVQPNMPLLLTRTVDVIKPYIK